MPHSRLQHDPFRKLVMEIVLLVSHLNFHVNNCFQMAFSPYLGAFGPERKCSGEPNIADIGFRNPRVFKGRWKQ